MIDPCVYETAPGTFKMWYKDEDQGSHTYAACSEDLYHWTVLGEEAGDCAHEGPNVFELRGKKWMITGCWDGLAVYSSEDFRRWKREEGNLLREGGLREKDQGRGHHADVLVLGERAFIFYFVHPCEESGALFEVQRRQTVIQAAELEVSGGRLLCRRAAGRPLVGGSGV